MLIGEGIQKSSRIKKMIQELVAEVRRGLKEEKKVHKRIFIKVYSPRAGSQVEEGAISFKIRAGLPSVDQIA